MTEITLYSIAGFSGWISVAYDDEVNKVVIRVGNYGNNECKIYLTADDAIDLATALLGAIKDCIRRQ